MKIGNFFRTACKAMALAVVAFPMFVSCYDDKALIQDMENMKSDISALEERVAKIEKDLKDQVSGLQTLIGNVEKSLKFSVEQLGGKVDGNYESLSDMIAALDKKYGDFASTFQTTLQGLVTVKDVKTNADGSVTVTLSDMTQFVVYPKHVDPYKNVVTTIVIDGVIYWAQYVDDNVVPFVDADGNKIPVVPEGDNLVTPEFKVEEGYIWISFDGGANWDKTGIANSDATIFSGAEEIMTEVSEYGYTYEVPTGLMLYLPDGSTITLEYDNVSYFELYSEEEFVYYGKSVMVSYYTSGIENFIVQAPNGWSVSEVEMSSYMGKQTMLKIFAPTKAAVEMGTAAAEGYVKIIGVTAAGKSVSASLFVSTNPFKTFSYADNAFTVLPYGDMSTYFYYGISKVADFNKDEIISQLTAYVNDEVYTYPGLGDFSLEGKSAASIFSNKKFYPGEELQAGETYIFWAVPRVDEMVIMEDPNFGTQMWDQYYIFEDTFVTKEFKLQNISVEVTKCDFINLDISVQISGIDHYFADLVDLEYYYGPEELLYTINQQAQVGAAIPNMYEDTPYVGSAVDFNYSQCEILPGRKYMFYIIPYVEGKTYTAEDLDNEKYVWHFETDPLMAGGKFNVTAAEYTPTSYNTISVNLAAEGAYMMYYKFVDPKYVSANTVETLINSGEVVIGDECVAKKYSLSAGTTMSLLAIAVDEYGLYGDMLVKDFSTKSIDYNDVVVGLELESASESEAIVKVTSSSSTATLKYYFGNADAYTDYNWWSIGTDEAAISEKYALNQNRSYFNTMTLTDGKFVANNLVMGESYRLAVVAEENGTVSKAFVLEFDVKMSLGEFVRAVDPMTGEANPVWEAAKPNIHDVKVETVADFTTVTWDVDVPAGYEVAVSRCISPEYIASFVTPDEIVRYLLTNADDIDSSSYITTIGDWDENDNWIEVPVADPYWSNPYASAGCIIYVVLKDAQGNYYEAYEHDPKITGGGGFGV